MSSSRTPPEAHSNPKGSPALSTPPQALGDAGSPHSSGSKPTGATSKSASLPPRPSPRDPALAPPTPDQRAQLSRAAVTTRYGGPPPRMPPPPLTAAQADAYNRALPPILATTKWSKWIGVFSWVSCVGVGTYMVLFMPLGDKETVFHPVRRKFFGIVDRLNGTYDEGKVQAELAKARVDWEEMEAKQKKYAEERFAQGPVWGTKVTK